mmetsp:Transcript_35161/g.54945  ORF Transcript_35161/g.54945 Transcript_35161/m.54945 type:complete len:227 (+) Transcript_35161:127-807(+)|eukprot:CAMPEP_0184304160 /NCGR_PEP_ID=MMETSP1049-20130417/13755_1 /TAXON_ID=77928 /ORGANISM="Proteomonas sulcata, Strain CCMP704" /LENGTH=226 /DNA_ID=CAMNT_0026615907 /DNA_START=115 /DNA_END=795 /DNA_ORIENTATION=+
MAGRYANMELDEPGKENSPPVEEIIEAEGDDEDFVDLVDDFEGLEDGEDEGDISYVSMGGENEEDDDFDMTIGALEEIMMDEEFQEMQNNFAAENCCHFEDTDENKLVYTEIFGRYTKLIENYIEHRLQENIHGFSMQSFMESLIAREEEMRSSDVFDMLVSCADFDTFKEIMLSYKQQREGGGIQLHVGVMPLELHTDEQEDGEERPDLILSISPVSSPKKPPAV